MRCPFCGNPDQKVLDSRPAVEGDAIRRRRECAQCGRRFTTHERFERPRLYVVKRDGTREEFDREKCLYSMTVACRKRGVPVDRLREAVGRVERDLFREADAEVATSKVGESVLRELRGIDPVAFVRFASVYREFGTPEDFHSIIEEADFTKQPGWLKLD
ncbi:transcriptional repressor NrdR [bacterium]|nr:MAG: transcriptional repressor NrdR [bacterium]